MLEFWDRLMERPKWQLIAMWVGSVAFIGFIFWQYLISSTLTEYERLSEKSVNLKSQVAIETNVLNNLPKLKAEFEKVTLAYEGALTRLPRKREMATFLENISELAKDSGLEVVRFAPQADQAKNFFAEIPVNVEMKGTYHQVATFFDELSRMSRVVNVRDIALKDARTYRENASVIVEVSGVLKTFRYLEPEERIVAPGAGDDANNNQVRRK